MSDPDAANMERTMLYSAASLTVATAYGNALGHGLKRHALRIARDDGRTLVTAKDVLAAAEELGLGWMREDPNAR